MRRIDKTSQYVRLLSRLEDIAAARCILATQLEELDMRARAVQVEIESLRNLDAPISILPDEVLSMIFEAGGESTPGDCMFGILVSHVTHHWRSITLSNPKVWTDISFQKTADIYSDQHFGAYTAQERESDSRPCSQDPRRPQ